MYICHITHVTGNGSHFKPLGFYFSSDSIYRILLTTTYNYFRSCGCVILGNGLTNAF